MTCYEESKPKREKRLDIPLLFGIRSPGMTDGKPEGTQTCLSIEICENWGLIRSELNGKSCWVCDLFLLIELTLEDLGL